jgi:hypothetical protein
VVKAVSSVIAHVKPDEKVSYLSPMIYVKNVVIVRFLFQEYVTST